MSDIGSLFAAGTLLSLGGLGLYLYQSNDDDDDDNKKENIELKVDESETTKDEDEAEVYFSNFFYLLHANLISVKSRVAVAAITVHTSDGPRNVEAMTDTGGAVNIASRHLLTNILPAKRRGNPHC